MATSIQRMWVAKLEYKAMVKARHVCIQNVVLMTFNLFPKKIILENLTSLL